VERSKIVGGVLILTAFVVPVLAEDSNSKQAIGQHNAGSVRGTVTDHETGSPVRRATISLAADGKQSASVISDEGGGFEFRSVPAGVYTLSAAKTGYLTSISGQASPGNGRLGVPLRISAGQNVKGLIVKMSRGASLIGVVRDRYGDPVMGALVRAMRFSMATGRRLPALAGFGLTDERGMYRIAVLPPGDYVVSIAQKLSADSAQSNERMMRLEMALILPVSSPEQQMRMEFTRLSLAAAEAKSREQQLGAGLLNSALGPTTGIVTMYYPGTTASAAAQVISLALSEARSGIDIQMQELPFAPVSGIVSGGPTPIASTTIVLTDVDQALSGFGPLAVNAQSDGTFKFPPVPPGHYRLSARSVAGVSAPSGSVPSRPTATSGYVANREIKSTTGGGLPVWWAGSDISVNDQGSPMTVLMNLQEGLSVSGRLLTSGGAPADDSVRLTVGLVPAFSTPRDRGVPSVGYVQADGRFVISGVMPGSYRLMVSDGNSSPLRLDSAVFGGADVLDLLDVQPDSKLADGVLKLTVGHSRLEGSVRGHDERAAPPLVIVFADNPRAWVPGSTRIQVRRATVGGYFAFTDLPAGAYRLGVIRDAEQGEWYDADFLRRIVPSSVIVAVFANQLTKQDLQIK
jgi:hypothetical protein